jgi:histidyl-tRNA synthetase
VLGGGRYDGLIEALGGPVTPAVGWAAGIERLAMLVDDFTPFTLDAVVVLEDDAARGLAMRALNTLRQGGFATEIVASGSPRKRFDKAVKLGARTLVSIKPEQPISVRTDGSERGSAAEQLVLTIG